ncbi:hypothetical protein EV182_005330 [Spiromyces aspiralis]|uniref:Uncharacterized protein n=1 Tax=Spiromyces aspiralis TaxID=68401 RepID=A0ACC1HHK3_9FUNG|nr:hypothetical protein EV182_005330 [Spiromyces aspiralis]
MSDANGNIAPLTIVTAAVDRIDLSSPLRLDRNYRISGMVTYTGYSSLEVFMTLNAIDDKGNIIDSERVLSARFTMVARDKYTDKAAQVNPLLLQNDEERRLFKIAEMIKEHKKTNSQRTLSKLPPTAEERIIMHDLWLETNSYITSLYKSSTVPLPRDMAWLDETTMESVTLCFPQERNIHNKIFGGYLMRLAHELAFANASVFIQDHALYVSLDDFSFRAPVNIGSILRLTSEVVYTQRESNTFQVAVRADVIDNTKGTVHNTNTFYFTFQAPNGPIKKVIPRTYSDMMKYLEGRRRHTMGSYIAKLEQAL